MLICALPRSPHWRSVYLGTNSALAAPSLDRRLVALDRPPRQAVGWRSPARAAMKSLRVEVDIAGGQSAYGRFNNTQSSLPNATPRSTLRNSALCQGQRPSQARENSRRSPFRHCRFGLGENGPHFNARLIALRTVDSPQPA